MNRSTEQESFWENDFGNKYIERNKDYLLLASNLSLFSRILGSTQSVKTVLEFGANIGMNIKALKQLLPNTDFFAIEINKKAHSELEKLIGKEKAHYQSIFDYSTNEQVDLSFIKGVLIHINPDKLKLVYKKLYTSSKRYILIAEYYNPSPVSLPYRGHNDKLFKRDFAGELLDLYSDLRLIDYGFVYHRDPNFPQDDITWFLLEKVKN